MDKNYTGEDLIILLIGLVIMLVIFYYLIRGAVKNGALAAHKEIENYRIVLNATPENEAQEKLKKQFLNGGMEFSQFKYQWNKHKTNAES